MRIDDNTVFQESATIPLIQIFEKDQSPIFVIYGASQDFKDAINTFGSHFQTREEHLFLSLDMEHEKRDTPGETLFEIVQQLIDSLIDNAFDAEEKVELFETFRMLEKLKKRTREYEAEDKLAEFMGFAESICYPILGNVFVRRNQSFIIEFTRFEEVSEWGIKIRNFILDRLLEKAAGLNLRFVLFVKSNDRPTLFYGSNQEGMAKRVTFYKLAGTNGDNNGNGEYKDNYRTDVTE